VLYVGKSVSLRTRARAHFAPSAASEGWTEQAAIVDHRTTNSELAALVLEHRLIRELRPPGNVIHKRDDAFVYLRCRLDIAYPVLEVAREPAAGHAVTIGPLRSRAAAVELKEQLDSLFGLRHCGRKLRLRPWPSAYGQMGRCLSPCLNDLDPNLYRRRLDEALALFTGDGDGGAALLAHLDAQMQAAAAERRYERAAWLRRRRDRIAVLVRALGGTLAATHVRPQLVLAPHPRAPRFDAFWLVGGRVADWAALDEAGDLHGRTLSALARAGGELRRDAIGEARIVQTWLAAHAAPALALEPVPTDDAIATFVAAQAG
jgi:DNA polymerase-3 subunit epsilon